MAQDQEASATNLALFTEDKQKKECYTLSEEFKMMLKGEVSRKAVYMGWWYMSAVHDFPLGYRVSDFTGNLHVQK